MLDKNHCQYAKQLDETYHSEEQSKLILIQEQPGSPSTEQKKK
jgi:hypothetical protein